MLTIREALQKGGRTLRGVSATPELDARVILGHVLGKSHLDLVLDRAGRLTRAQTTDYLCLIKRRKAHEPVAYLVGRKEFMGLDFHVARGVLIPRPDTETLVEAVLRYLKQSGKESPEILDLGCGSGAIGLSLARHHPGARVTLVDLSDKALAVTEKNAGNLGIEARIIKSDLFEALEGSYQVVVSNPPYIDPGQYETLAPDVRNYEPRQALLAQRQGLAFYEVIIPGARRHLLEKGLLALEIGFDQGESVRALMAASGYSEIEVIPDLGGHHRVVLGLRGE